MGPVDYFEVMSATFVARSVTTPRSRDSFKPYHGAASVFYPRSPRSRRAPCRRRLRQSLHRHQPDWSGAIGT